MFDSGAPCLFVLILSACVGLFTELLKRDVGGLLEELLAVLLVDPWLLVTARKEHECKLDPCSPLRKDLPAGVLSTEVDLLRLEGHLGDPDVASPALAALLSHHRDSMTGVTVVNPSGCGKTKAVLDLLRVSLKCLGRCSCGPRPCILCVSACIR